MHWAKTIEHNLERTLHYITEAARAGSRVVLFPETNLTSYYFPYAVALDPARVEEALWQTCEAAASHDIWVIAGSLRKTHDRMLNLVHVIAPSGEIVHEYAKVHSLVSRFVRVSLATGTTAPVGSTTMPEIPPVKVCAYAPPSKIQT